MLTRQRQPEAGRSLGLARIDLAFLVAATALLFTLITPLLAQLRGDDWAAITREHLRQYGRAHLLYVADYDLMPPLGGTNGVGWSGEVGVFDTDHDGLVIGVDEGAKVIMNGFVGNYIADPAVFTSPADTFARYTEPGAGFGERLGNFLVPDEDPQAVGATLARLWFNRLPDEPAPCDYSQEYRRFYVEIDGVLESFSVPLLRADVIQSPADAVDVVEEDEDSILNNSLFTTDSVAWQPPPFEPGESNVITDRHPGEGGHVSFHDGHVELLTDIVSRYWAEPDYADRLRLLWRTAP